MFIFGGPSRLIRRVSSRYELSDDTGSVGFFKKFEGMRLSCSQVRQFLIDGMKTLVMFEK